MEKIGERVRRLREEQGIARKDLAFRAGMSYTALSDLELGKTGNTTKLRLLADELGVDVDWLETGKGDPCHKSSPHSHHTRLDDEIVSATHGALAELYRDARRIYPQEDVARFVRLYEQLAARKAGVPEAELFGAGFTGNAGESSRERSIEVPGKGASTKVVARRIRRKA